MRRARTPARRRTRVSCVLACLSFCLLPLKCNRNYIVTIGGSLRGLSAFLLLTDDHHPRDLSLPCPRLPTEWSLLILVKS